MPPGRLRHHNAVIVVNHHSLYLYLQVRKCQLEKGTINGKAHSPQPALISAIQMTLFDPDKVYVITRGLGGLGKQDSDVI